MTRRLAAATPRARDAAGHTQSATRASHGGRDLHDEAAGEHGKEQAERVREHAQVRVWRTLQVPEVATPRIVPHVGGRVDRVPSASSQW